MVAERFGGRSDSVRMRTLLSAILVALSGTLLLTLTTSADGLRETETLHLEPGSHLVRWLGADEVSLGNAVGSIQDKLAGIAICCAEDGAWRAYRSNTLNADAAVINYGDWLALYVLKDVEWERPIEPAGAVNFSDAVATEDRHKTLAEIRDFERLLADRYAFLPQRYQIYVGEQAADLHDLLLAHGRRPYFEPNWRGCPGGPADILLKPDCYDVPGSVVAMAAMGAILGFGGPGWTSLSSDLRLGLINQIGVEAESDEKALAERTTYHHNLDYLINTARTREHAPTTRSFNREFVAWLAERFGEPSLFDYFAALKQTGGAEDAVERAFGLSRAQLDLDWSAYAQGFWLPETVSGNALILTTPSSRERSAQIHETIASVDSWFVSRFGFDSDTAIWLVEFEHSRIDLSQGCGCGKYSGGLTQIYNACVEDPAVYAHEYFHHLQGELIGAETTEVFPRWITEGFANMADVMFDNDHGNRPYLDSRNYWTDYADRVETALSDPPAIAYEGYEGELSAYILGALAAEWLTASTEGVSMDDFFRYVGKNAFHPDDSPEHLAAVGERSFSEFWGLPMDEFYEHFACWRARGFPVEEAGNPCLAR